MAYAGCRLSQHHGDRRESLSLLQQAVQHSLPAPLVDVELPVFSERVDRLLGVLGAMRAWVAEFDESGAMIYASPQVEIVLGFTPEEALNGRIEFHPDDLPVLIATSRKLRGSGEITTSQTRVRHKQGHWVWRTRGVG